MHAGKEKRPCNTVTTYGGIENIKKNIIKSNIKEVILACSAASCSKTQYCNTYGLINNNRNNNYNNSKQYFNKNTIRNCSTQSAVRNNYQSKLLLIGSHHSTNDDSKSIKFKKPLDNCLILKKYRRQALLSTHYYHKKSLIKARKKDLFKSYCKKQKIVYKSYRNLRRTSSSHLCNTASSLSSSSSSSSLSSVPSNNCYLQKRHILHANFKLFIYWHAISLLACFVATGICVRAAVSESSFNLHNMNSVKEDISNLAQHLTSTTNPSTVVNTVGTTFIHENPFLKYSRSTLVRLGLSSDTICYIWSSLTPFDLCKLSPWQRYQFLLKISIFKRDCSEDNNIKAAQLFRLNVKYVNNEADLQMLAKFLHEDNEGQACILAPSGAQQCLSCFQKVDRGIKQVDKAYEKFNLTLHRFDCLLAVDTASATRPFSPNGSCSDCKVHNFYFQSFTKKYSF
ncbi:unnamed protein product [Thelazia callipaeda]|uniref:USP domain-containing protein n=1 Tax=Thelazia callipaeda TaxID=103827 RepID=A0A0N5DAU9_THECL|nr:unnamed protein product [Thelazia callipaeda]